MTYLTYHTLVYQIKVIHNCGMAHADILVSIWFPMFQKFNDIYIEHLQQEMILWEINNIC